MLVVAFSITATVLMGTAIDFGFSSAITDVLSGVGFIGLGALLFAGYFALRTSVRQLADAPDELLDEMQIAVRNEVYLHAYRLTALLLVIVFVVVLIGVSEWANLWFATAMMMAAIPSMVLAWTLPEEK
jgi:hypothetical protein